MLGRITARAQTCAITAWVFRDKCVQLIAIECLILPPLGYIGGIHSIHSHRNYRTRKADPSALKKMISTDGAATTLYHSYVRRCVHRANLSGHAQDRMLLLWP